MEGFEDEINGGEDDLTKRDEGCNEQNVSRSQDVSQRVPLRPILRGENEHVDGFHEGEAVVDNGEELRVDGSVANGNVKEGSVCGLIDRYRANRTCRPRLYGERQVIYLHHLVKKIVGEAYALLLDGVPGGKRGVADAARGADVDAADAADGCDQDDK